ncbi:MAG: GAF domain-containing sensor histidine kinase [Acidobacteriota bacterium]|nr:GAF domain-containing sensor histidine kinase [Acidobacteriota bacterium]
MKDLEDRPSREEQPSAEQPSAELRAVLDVAEGVLAELDVEVVLGRVLEAARELTAARYAAVGVLDETRSELERFLTSGIDAATRAGIGHLPRGRGVLGELIVHPVPLRLDDVSAHPASYGFPPGHPPMKTFLGVPLQASGQPFGNIYLTDKAGGIPFTADDERALVALARLAGIAIDHARRFAQLESQRAELERTVAALDATVQIAQAVGAETNLDAVLKLVATRGRTLIAARALMIEREIDGDMVVVAAAGELPSQVVGRVLGSDGSIASAALREHRTMRLEDAGNRARFEQHGAGQFGLTAEAGLIVPMRFRARGYGVLMALDRLEDGPEFSAHDQRMLEAFATSAATAIATAVSVQAERATQRLMAAEHERARWARELHDETLQNLAALQIAVAGHLRTRNPEAMAAFMSDAAEQLATEIQNLRSLIAELRPAALDDLGLGPAVIALVERTRQNGLNVRLSIDLLYDGERAPERLAQEVETAIYRITQEALTNVRKHGGADNVNVDLWEDRANVHLTVQDDGHGFDPDARTQGFGLTGIRERVELLRGELELSSIPGKGTTLSVTVPSRRAFEPPAPVIAALR